MREFLENTKTNGFSLWVILCILITTFFFFIFVLYSPSSYTISTQIQIHPTYSPFHDDNPIKDKYKKCDLFKGEWVKDPKEPPYTNATCPTIPTTKDCFLHGRKDKDFLYWRWKPEKCELPRFEPETFLKIMNNKKLAFIGDSIARNQIDSLICLLTQQESPIDVYKDAKDRSRVWFFPKSNFTLMVFWTRFLVKGDEKEGGVFDLHLDQVDEKWGYNVSQGEVDYAIVSSVQWYFKKHYLYEKGDLIGCLNCNEDDHLTEFSVSFAVKKAFQTAFRYINGCKACKDMVTIARTISPSHFEHGTWRTGGDCERSKPYNEAQLKHLLATHNKSSIEWQVRNLQMEEIEHAMNERRSRSQKFKAMDITKIMLVRPDGHPGPYWRDKKKKFNDCVHWCMPGPIDVWNDLLLALLLD